VILIQENFLHYIWKQQFFAINKLQTTNSESLQIYNVGGHNLNSGPDFFNAKLEIGSQLWAGNVEIHVKSSDWYLHQHEIDKNYDNVILHVVWIHDTEIYRKNNVVIPTLELKQFVSIKAISQYQKLFSKKEKWINCENYIGSVDKFILNNWLEVLYFERLEQKSKLIIKLLKHSANDWETVLFQLLSMNFGLKVNGAAFLNLAESFDYKIIRKERDVLLKLEALLFGQAGFLDEEKEAGYYIKLQKEYHYLQLKYQLSPLYNGQFQFFRLRPNNFPTIRLAQFAMLNYKHQNLFSKILEAKYLDDYYQIFGVKTSSYWETHYSFNSMSVKRSKTITKPFINLLLINTIIPLKFMYYKHIGKLNDEFIIELVQQISFEKNSVINKFESLLNKNLKGEQKINNALESQAFLQLKIAYCNNQNCLQCAIGNSYLKG